MFLSQVNIVTPPGPTDPMEDVGGAQCTIANTFIIRINKALKDLYPLFILADPSLDKIVRSFLICLLRSPW